MPQSCNDEIETCLPEESAPLDDLMQNITGGRQWDAASGLLIQECALQIVGPDAGMEDMASTSSEQAKDAVLLKHREMSANLA